MFKKYLTLSLTFLIINLSLSAAVFAETNAEKEAKFAEKIKTNITKLGTGTNAKVEVKLRDGTKLKGYVSQIGEDSFVVTGDKTGVSTNIPYPNARQVRGNNLSTGVQIAIKVGIIVGIILLAGLITRT